MNSAQKYQFAAAISFGLTLLAATSTLAAPQPEGIGLAVMTPQEQSTPMRASVGATLFVLTGADRAEAGAILKVANEGLVPAQISTADSQQKTAIGRCTFDTRSMGTKTVIWTLNLQSGRLTPDWWFSKSGATLKEMKNDFWVGYTEGLWEQYLFNTSYDDSGNRYISEQDVTIVNRSNGNERRYRADCEPVD